MGLAHLFVTSKKEKTKAQRRIERADLCLELNSLTEYLMEEKEYEAAAIVETARRYIMESKL